MSTTRILSIDGGEIRGIILAVLLLSLEKSLQKHSHNPYTSKFKVEEILQFYKHNGSHIFSAVFCIRSLA